MPFYRNLNPKENDDDKRTIERLLLLREQLKEIPERTQKETLLLATWNIRDFDTVDHGKRLDEAIYYIAEIIDRFDLVAVQEVNNDLTGLNRLMYWVDIGKPFSLTPRWEQEETKNAWLSSMINERSSLKD